MRSRTTAIGRRRTLRVLPWAGFLILLTLVTGCPQSRDTQETVVLELDLTRSGEHKSGAWTYAYSITDPGSRSEGRHGSLSYNQSELPAPMHVNDFYETPWGRLYWVGQPTVLFGPHGWMPAPLVREPMGRASIDPAIVHSARFMVRIKILTAGELGTPDRLERDPAVLKALKLFGLAQAHIQGDWLPLGPDPITLHDTKRWGRLTVCRADLNTRPAPALEFTCTGDLTVDTSPKPASMAEIMALPEFPARPDRVFLSPQADTLQPLQCTLSPIVGDPLVLYVVCRIHDQGPKPPWTSPSIRIWEAEPSASAVDP